MRNPIFRLGAMLLLTILLVACQVSSTGAINYKGRPMKAEIVQVDNGLTIEGYDVYLDNQLIGRTKEAPGQKNPVFARKSSVEFVPLKSRLGEVRVVRNFDFGSASFDVFIDGTYAGTVQMAQV